MKPQTKKSLKQERIEKEEKRRKELENLNKNLIKKLYADLFQMNVDLYQEHDFTFENFLFGFYKEIENNLDFNNPNYNQLLQKMDLKIKAKFNEYKKALFEEEKRKLKEEKEKKTKEYFNELDNQINIKKNFIDPIEKKKNEIYDYDLKEENQKLENQKIENQGKIDNIRRNLINDIGIKNEYLNELENQNLLLNQENKNLISDKILFFESINNEESKKSNFPIEEIEQILLEKNVDKIKDLINTMKYKKELRNQMDENVKRIERPNKMSVEERKINKDLLQAAREYFKNHH